MGPDSTDPWLAPDDERLPRRSPCGCAMLPPLGQDGTRPDQPAPVLVGFEIIEPGRWTPAPHRVLVRPPVGIFPVGSASGGPEVLAEAWRTAIAAGAGASERSGFHPAGKRAGA